MKIKWVEGVSGLMLWVHFIIDDQSLHEKERVQKSRFGYYGFNSSGWSVKIRQVLADPYQEAFTLQKRLASMVCSSSRTGKSNEAQTNLKCLPSLKDQLTLVRSTKFVPCLDDVFFRRQFPVLFSIVFLFLQPSCTLWRMVSPLRLWARPWIYYQDDPLYRLIIILSLRNTLSPQLLHWTSLSP